MNYENTFSTQSKVKGFSLVIIAATLWGISGPVAQYLFEQHSFSPEWLVVVRLLMSGILLLGLAYRKEKFKVWGIWRDKNDRLSLLLFSILGILAVQYTFFAAIKNGNAATATVLQYLAPVIITGYLAIRSKRFPSVKEITALLLAIAGTFLLITHGNIHSLSISGLTVFWGLSSALALAFYTLQPHRILQKWGSTIVIGWGMLIGGVAFSPIHFPWIYHGSWSIPIYLSLFFIIIFGTLIAFFCYLESLKYISASQSSLLACLEPLSATLLSVAWLNVSFGFMEWIGTFCILCTIVLLSASKNNLISKNN
ncbi:DMT family transporter [Priestia megaterium]|uniref:DMT family transporter n=1 Tax=Priestia megaterium TaxID=1404 RepID=UPI0035E0E56F